MPNTRRKFERPLGERPYKKLFIIAVEDKVKEPHYYQIFNNLYPQSVVHVKCLKGTTESSPAGVLKRMESHLKREGLKPSDEAWVVVDKDNWRDDQLVLLYNWSQTRDNYHFALSNPKFEYWLLLHFEDGKGVTTVQECDKRLKKHIPKYGSSYDFSVITKEYINIAVERAKKRDDPPCKDWPRNFGVTTVYRLVEKIALSGKAKRSKS